MSNANAKGMRPVEIHPSTSHKSLLWETCLAVLPPENWPVKKIKNSSSDGGGSGSRSK